MMEILLQICYIMINLEKGEKMKNEQLYKALEKVIDPELGIDIVNLGLIYDINLNEQGTAKVLMTLTTMGCPLIDMIAFDIERALLAVDGVEKVEIELTFDPAWSIDRMSRYAKIALGVSL